MMEQYGEQLEVISFDTSQPGGQELYDASTEQFNVSAEMQGVPRMVVGGRFLVGSLQIPEEFPGIVEEGLASGGIDWPAIPGLAQALAAQKQAEPTKAVEQTPTLATASENIPKTGVNSLVPPRQKYWHVYEIEEEYDRFDNHTAIHLRADVYEAQRRPEGSLSASYWYPGTTPSIPETVSISFAIIHENWQFQQCHHLRLLVDGRSMRLETTYDGDVITGNLVGEMVFAWLSAQDFLEIVNAEKVEVRLCLMEFEFTPAQMEALRDLASRMQP
jgi:hypothetical protein